MCDAEVLHYRWLPKLSNDGTKCFHIELHEMWTAYKAFRITEMLRQKCVTAPNTTLLEDGQTRLQVPSVHFLWYWLRYNNDGAAVSIKSNTNQVVVFLHSYSFSEQFKDCLMPWHCYPSSKNIHASLRVISYLCLKHFITSDLLITVAYYVSILSTSAMQFKRWQPAGSVLWGSLSLSSN